MSKPLLVFNVISGIIFLCCAVAAEGGYTAFFGDPALVAFFLITAALLAAASVSQGNIRSGLREDRGNRWVLPLFFVFGFGSVIAALACDRPDIGTFGGEGVRWLGVALYGLGGVLRIAPVFVLGVRFSGLVAIQPGHTLQTDGLYARIRHPSYLGLMLGSIGLALVFRSGPGLALALLLLFPLVGRIQAEERLLAETFGAEYEAYRKRTWRLIPGVY